MKRRAQSTVELCVLIAVVTAALIAMQVFIKRSIQGRLRVNIDEISQGWSYSPACTIGSSTTETQISETSKTNTEDIDGKDTTVSRSESQFVQSTKRQEQTLPFALEPQPGGQSVKNK